MTEFDEIKWDNISPKESSCSNDITTNIIDSTIYESLYEELCIKCSPEQFLEPYNQQKVRVSNSLYSELISLTEFNTVELISIRARAISELGISFSTGHIFPQLKEACYPRNFMKPYDATKVELANKYYSEVLQSEADVVKLEQLLEEVENNLEVTIVLGRPPMSDERVCAKERFYNDIKEREEVKMQDEKASQSVAWCVLTAVVILFMSLEFNL